MVRQIASLYTRIAVSPILLDTRDGRAFGFHRNPELVARQRLRRFAAAEFATRPSLLTLIGDLTAAVCARYRANGKHQLDTRDRAATCSSLCPPFAYQFSSGDSDRPRAGRVIRSNCANSKVKQVRRSCTRHAPRPASSIRLYNVARRVLRMLMHVKPDTA